MCGICGVYGYRTGEPVDGEVVRDMTEAMLHRGPDDRGFYLDGALGMGVRRLSIIDLEGGAQPMANEDRSVITVSNGEIYNFRELRRELESLGHVFRTRSDTEAIVHAYEQWGLDCLPRLNGMFGLAIWDVKQRRLVLARDPHGVKPLYYSDDGSRLIFGSEIRAIIRHPGVRRELDTRALDQFLTLTFVPAPDTAFKGISKLRPGHALVSAADADSKPHRYYCSVPQPLPPECEDELVDRLREGIVRAVHRQTVADVPVGVMLSGGMDSTTVAAIMVENSTKPVRTFSVGFGDDFPDDELRFARTAAERLGTEHHEMVVSASEYVDFLPESIWHLEEPVATASTLAFYRLCQLARREVKVVLTGQGADELFAGYPRYLGARYASAYRGIPRLVRESVLAPAVRLLPRNERLKRAVGSLDVLDPVDRMVAIYTILDRDLKNGLYRDGMMSRDDVGRVVGAWQADVSMLDGLSQMLYVDARCSLPDNLLLYGDKMSMAVSLEARVPFLDLELMALAESIPAVLKIKGQTQKYILKRAVSKWVTADTLRRRKIGFATPVDEWFRGVMKTDLEDRLLAPGSACREYFRPAALTRMLREHQAGRHDYKRALFCLLTFEIWHEQFIRPSQLAAGRK